MTNVLIVDDEKSIRITLGEFLRREGYVVFTAENADAAAELLREPPVDVILSDIIMPRRPGTSLLRMIRDVYPDIQVIMITGEPTVATAVEAVRYAARDYLAKPIDRDELIKAVRHAAEFKQLLDEKRSLEQHIREHNENLERIVEERTKKLRQAMTNTVYAASAMIELRDPYPAGHQRRVGDLARAIGRETGLPEDTLEGLYMTGCIHDVGKIIVPSDILNKPGRLSPPEYEIIKEHAQRGYDLLKDFEMPWPVAEIVHQHHERLNGSGYPLGLKESEIRFETRIISVADVVEAMMSHRPYRPGLGMDAALAEIESARGVLYDPDVVDICAKLLKKGYQLAD
jgi:response regulator RpfG family c-di-GMP phosphodiesterase